MFCLWYSKDIHVVHGKRLFDTTENFSLLQISKRRPKENEQRVQIA